MVLTIILAILNAGLTFLYGYLFYSSLGPWYSLIALALAYPSFLVLFLLWIVFLFLWGKTFNLKKEVHKPNRFYYLILHDTDMLLMTLLNVKVIFRGKEKLPLGQRYVIVNNHRSNFDQMIMIKKFKAKDPLICVTKPENIKFPIAGPFIHHSGFVPINRDSMVEGVKDIQKAAKIVKEGYGNVAISPEGTRNKTDAILLPFHPGSFRLASEANAPLVISCLKRTNLIAGRVPLHHVRVYFDILEVIPAEEVKATPASVLCKRAYDRIKEDLEKEEF